FLVVPDFVSASEEEALLQELRDGKRHWLDKAHLKFSNTRQQEYGPQISDAMEVVEAEPRIPPTKTAALAQKVAREAQRLGLVASGLGQSGFCRVNLYNSGGYMHKHMDSKKCFGPVIACCSLLSDATMTFYDTGGSAYGLAKVRDTATAARRQGLFGFMDIVAGFECKVKAGRAGWDMDIIFQHLKLSKSRQNKGLPWLRWEEGDEREGEPGAQVEEFYEHMMWDVSPTRIYKGEAVQKLFKLIRHLRSSLPPPARVLKGCVKQIHERKKAEEGERTHEEQKEDEVTGQEGEEEAELEDDEIIEVEEKPPQLKRLKPIETPVRRLAEKTNAAEEEILFVGSGKSKEKQELDEVLDKISKLKLTPDNDKALKEPDLVDPQMQRSMRNAKKAAISAAKARGKGKGAGKKSKGKGKQKEKSPERAKGQAPAATNPKAKAKASATKKKNAAEKILKVIFEIVSHMDIDLSQEYVALEFFVHHTMVSTTMKASLGSIPGTGLGIHVDGGAALIWPPAEPSPLAAVDLQGESVSGDRFWLSMTMRQKNFSSPWKLFVTRMFGETSRQLPHPSLRAPNLRPQDQDSENSFDPQAKDFDTRSATKSPKAAAPTPRKSLLSTFDNADAKPAPPSPTHVLTLAAPQSESEKEEEDGMLKIALQSMIDVSSAEEDKDIYGAPLKAKDPVDCLTKDALAKLEATLRRACKPDRKGCLQVPEQVHKMWKNGGSSRRELRKVLLQCGGQKELFTQKVNHTYKQTRKDKYQKKLIWYYCDIAYEGVRSDKDEEQLTRDTMLGEGGVSDVPLGLGASLPNLSSDDEDDVEDEDDDEEDEDGEEPKQPPAKLGKRKTKEALDDVTEDVEGIPALLDEILSLSGRSKKVLDRHAELLQKQLDQLAIKHDELADIKSAYDCEETIDSKKLTSLMGEINKLTVLTGAKTKPEKSKPDKSGAPDPVSHELVAGLAHAVETEINESFGEEAATKLQSYKLLCKMSRGHSTGHAAQKTRDALDRMPESQAPIQVTGVDIGLAELFPCILFSDYLRVLADQNKLDVLTRGVDLEAFRDKMQPLKPRHPVFSLPASARASTIPLYLIGDEGRGYKKSAVFVLGSESMLGEGCDAEDSQTAEDKMKMNFVGNTMLTRQLFACIPKYLYAKDDKPLHNLVTIWAKDFAKLFYDGLAVGSTGCTKTWRVAVMGLKGDWPALDKLGRLLRQWFKGADTTFVLKFLVFKFETTLASDALQGHSDLEYLRTILEFVPERTLYLYKVAVAKVVIPRRSLYFMTGPSRSQWQHGIKKDHCPKERLSLTFRSVLPDAPRAVCCKGLLLSSCLLDFMTGDKVRAQSCRETLRQRLQEARIDVEWPGEGGSSSSSAPATSGTGSLPQDMTSGHTLEGLYALPAWQHRWTMQSHLDGVRCVFLDDKNSLLVSCGEDVVVKCWDLSSIWQMPGADELEPYAAFRGHSAPVFTLAFRPQDRTLFSAGMDSTIRAWLLPESGEGILRRGELVGHTDAVWSLQHHAHLPYLATASSDGLVGLWSAEDDKEKPKPREERWMDEAKITASERAWSEAVTSLEAVMNKTIQDGNATLQDFRSSTDKKRYQKEMAILDKRVCWATAVVDGSIQSKIDEQKTLLGKPQAAAAAATTTSDMSALSRAAPTWEELKSIATLRMDANKYRTCATCLCPGRPLQADALTRGGCRMQASLMLRQPGGGSSEELDVPTTVCWVPADTTRLLAGYVSSRIAVFDVRKGTQVLDLLPP
ncbi:STRN3, partial [Symbiodinium microadriaticum]